MAAEIADIIPFIVRVRNRVKPWNHCQMNINEQSAESVADTLDPQFETRDSLMKAPHKGRSPGGRQ